MGCRTDCGIGNTSYGIRETATFEFDSPINVFGTFLFDLGDVGSGTTLTLMTDDNQSYTAAMGTGDDQECNERFFGIISDMDFTMAIITNSFPSDFVYLDNTYFGRANVAPIPTLTMEHHSTWNVNHDIRGSLPKVLHKVPTSGQVIRQRKTILVWDIHLANNLRIID